MTDQSAVSGSNRSAAGANDPERATEGVTLTPPTDIYETKDNFVMLLDMPGADPDSLNVTLERRVLTVSARVASNNVPEGYAPVVVEYEDGNYERAFTLSEQLDEQRIEALFTDGVLRLTLPKSGPGPAKKIEVKEA